MKKLALIMALVLTLSLFAGCGGTESAVSQAVSSAPVQAAEPEAEVPEEAPAEETPAEASAEEVSVVEEPVEEVFQEPTLEGEYWKFGFTNCELPLSDSGESLTLWMLAEPFMMLYPGVDMNETTYYKTLEEQTGVAIEITSVNRFVAAEQFNIMMAGGDYTDMISHFATLYTAGADAAIEDGIIYDLAEMLDTEMPNYKAALDLNPVFTRDSFTSGGYLPSANMLFYVSEGRTTGTLMRSDWLEETGLEAPVTYDDWYEMLTALKNNGHPGAYGLLGTGCDPSLATGYNTNGFYNDEADDYPFFVIDGAVEFGPATDKYKEYVTMVHQWHEEDLIYSDFVSCTPGLGVDDSLLVDGKVGIKADSRSAVDNLIALSGGEFSIVGIPFPVENEGDVSHVSSDTERVQNGVSITSSCENVELAARWLDYCYTDDATLLANFGVEGEALEFDENGQPKLTDLVLNNAEMITVAALCTYTKYGGAMICFGNRDWDSLSDEALAAMEIWEEGGTDYNYPPKASITLEESEIIAQYMPEIKTYCEEMTLKFIVGSADIETEWDFFVSTLMDLGVEEVTQVKQDAYDRYIA